MSTKEQIIWEIERNCPDAVLLDSDLYNKIDVIETAQNSYLPLKHFSKSQSYCSAKCTEPQSQDPYVRCMVLANKVFFPSMILPRMTKVAIPGRI
jgi:hypothetical protein